MARYGIWFIFGLIISLVVSACQLDSRDPLAILVSRPTDTPTPTFTPTVTSTPTQTPSPTPSATPTQTPSPTATPIPSDRLALAQRAYEIGDYETARQEFAALLVDPGADPNEQRLALHWRGRSELKIGDTSAAIATLKMFLQQHPGDELARAAQFNLAEAYSQNGQFDQAATTYLGTIIPDDAINVYIYERIGDVALQAQNYQRAIEAYQLGIEATEDVGFQVHFREGIAEAYLRQDQFDQAIAQYDEILAVAVIADYRAKILWLAGQAHLAAGDDEAGYDRYLEAVNNYPEANDSYLGLVELINAEVPVDEFQRGLVDYYAEAYQPAIAAFERYLNPTLPLTPTLILTPTETITQAAVITKTAVTDPLPLADQATWLIGHSWQALGQYNQAIAAFEQLIESYPGNDNWGQAHLEIAKAQVEQDRITTAKETYRNFAVDNPNHPLAPEALWRAARLELDGDLLTEAYANLRDLAEKYPTSSYATDALYWAGRAAFLDEEYEEAAEAWGLLLEDYPTSSLASFGGYWQARALMELGQDEPAEKVLRQISARSNEYYGLRARDLLGHNQPHTVLLQLPSPTQSVEEQAEAETWLRTWLGDNAGADLATLSAAITADPAYQRGQALLQMGLRPEALAEFETVKDDWWDNPGAMYQLSLYFAEQGLGRLSILAAARLIFLSPAAIPEEAPIFIQRLFYPIFFADVIFTETAAFDLDPALLISIMRQESLFEQTAESIVGARGLMQVMPATGDYVAERSGFGPFERAQLWLPFISVKFGTWYIDQQLAIFEGNQFAALAAYNAGPGNVLEWVKISDDLDLFVEGIPYFESRLYIRNIYVNLAAYRRIYGRDN